MSIALHSGMPAIEGKSGPLRDDALSFRLQPGYVELAPSRSLVEIFPHLITVIEHASDFVEPSVWPPGSNRPPAPDIRDVRLQPNEYGAVPLDRFDASQILRFDTAAAAIANDIERIRAENPDNRLFVLGETHSSTAEAIAQFLVFYLLTGEERYNLVHAIEFPTTPYVDELIDKLYDRDIDADEFLARASVALHHQYLAALIRHENETGENVEDPVDLDFWRRTLERDVVRNFDNRVRVVLLDRNRFTTDETGGHADRTAGMEAAIFDAMRNHPDSVIVAQIGKLHVLPDFVTNDDIRESGLMLNGVPGGRIPAERPLMPVLSEEFGDAATFFVGMQYRETGTGYHDIPTEPDIPVVLEMDPIAGGEYDVEATRARMIENGNCAPAEENCWAFTSGENVNFFMFAQGFYREVRGRDPEDVDLIPDSF